MSANKLPIKVQGIIFFVDLNHRKKILCLKRSLEDGGFWHILTGTLKPTESFFDCLRREAKEEIGVSNIKSISPEIHRFVWEKNKLPHWVFTYAVEIKSPTITLNKEHTEFKWLEPSKAYKLLESDSAKEALSNFIPL